MILTTFEPGSGSGEELYSHKGVQGGYVTLGQLELTVEDQVFQLEPGDSFQFESTRPHRYRNVGEKSRSYLDRHSTSLLNRFISSGKISKRT